MTRHLALVGPTAAGKSAVALAIAGERSDIEIVSLDSMQVYRGMDIGTAKPSRAEQEAVRHHLVDVADPSEDWSVVRTQRLAHEALADIESRHKRALLVGGTGLYVRAVVDALTIPGGDDDVRAALYAETEDAAGLAHAYARLQQRDPAAATRIEPDNRRRIVRALEVLTVTGRPFSSFGTGLDAYPPPAIDVSLVGLAVEPEELRSAIARRFATMREAGLVDEVRALAGAPGGLSRTARQAIGYKEILEHLAGDLPLDAALELAVARTRRFARRQRVWFRRDPRIVWIEAETSARAVAKSAAAAAAVLATWALPVTAGTT